MIEPHVGYHFLQIVHRNTVQAQTSYGRYSYGRCKTKLQMYRLMSSIKVPSERFRADRKLTLKEFRQLVDEYITRGLITEHPINCRDRTYLLTQRGHELANGALDAFIAKNLADFGIDVMQ